MLPTDATQAPPTPPDAVSTTAAESSLTHPTAPKSLLAALSEAEIAAIFSSALTARRTPAVDLTPTAAADLVLARRIARRRFRWFIAYVTADDAEPYQFDRFHESVIAELQAVFDGAERRLLLSAPPRHGKSRLCAILFPAFLLGARPPKRVIVASYSLELSREHVRTVRNIMLSAAFAELFLNCVLADDGQASDLLRTTRGGFIRGTGAGGLLTGLGGNLILDDLVRSQEDADSALVRNSTWSWYSTSARTRLPPDGFIVSIGTRWRHNDILGRLIAASDDGSGERWRNRNFPALNDAGEALWPSQFTAEDLRVTRRAMGPVQFQALYQGGPTAGAGDFFKAEWFRYYQPQDLPAATDQRVIVATDFALTEGSGDYSAIIIAALLPNGDLFLRHVWRQRASMDTTVAALVSICSRYRPTEWAFARDSIMRSVEPFIVQRLRDARVPPLRRVALSDQQNKAAKAGPLSGLAQERGIYLPEGADWIGDLLDEALAFPFGAHDDQVDALAHIGRAYNTTLRPRRTAPGYTGAYNVFDFPDRTGPSMRTGPDGVMRLQVGINELFETCGPPPRNPERI